MASPNARCTIPKCRERWRTSYRNGFCPTSNGFSAKGWNARWRRSTRGRRSICGSTCSRPTARRRAARSLVEGIAAEPTPWSSIGLRLTARVPLGGLVAFKDGLVEVQDEGSQITALLVDARPGMRVVDFCAGAGGKTLALAAQMANRGKLVACDVSARRLEKGGAPAAPRRGRQCRAAHSDQRARQMG